MTEPTGADFFMYVGPGGEDQGRGPLPLGLSLWLDITIRVCVCVCRYKCVYVSEINIRVVHRLLAHLGLIYRDQIVAQRQFWH